MRLAKACEFEILKQGSLTVQEYDIKFNRLALFAPFVLLDERDKIRRFILGLRPSLCQLVGLQIETYPTFEAMVNTTIFAKMVE